MAQPTDKTRVLVVEDNALLALNLVDALFAKGFSAFAVSTSRAIETLADADYDVVVFAYDSSSCERIAAAIQSRGAPIVLLTNRQPDELPKHLMLNPTLSKLSSPALVADVVEELRMMPSAANLRSS